VSTKQRTKKPGGRKEGVEKGSVAGGGEQAFLLNFREGNVVRQEDEKQQAFGGDKKITRSQKKKKGRRRPKARLHKQEAQEGRPQKDRGKAD